VNTDLKPSPRRSERKPAKIAVILLVESEVGQVEHEAYTSDLSQYGVRLQSGIPLSPGQLVGVIPTNGPGFGLRGRVIWTGRAESDLAGEAGLEFLQPLPIQV
jgi:hypothetical protein